jgi:hypothetical protein
LVKKTVGQKQGRFLDKSGAKTFFNWACGRETSTAPTNKAFATFCLRKSSPFFLASRP